MILRKKSLLLILNKANGYILPYGEELQRVKVMKIDNFKKLNDSIKETLKR